MFGRLVGIALVAITLTLGFVGPPDLEAAPRVKSCPHCGTLYSGSLARGTYTEYAVTAAPVTTGPPVLITTRTEVAPVVKWRPVRQFYYVTTSQPAISVSTSTITATSSGRCTCPGCNCDAKAVADASGPGKPLPPMATSAGPPQ